MLYTVFKRVDNHKLTQVPNIVLNTLWIQNISRSKAMREQLLMYIHFDTTLEDIQLLKNEMQAFVLDKDNCRDFQPDIDVEVTGISEMNKLELRVEIRHKVNHYIHRIYIELQANFQSLIGQTKQLGRPVVRSLCVLWCLHCGKFQYTPQEVVTASWVAVTSRRTQ